ncbi:hypothetical protein SH2C18_31080 [Clostridium sediminicola]|uniref:YvrJ family protein n=1 Tax=Clostridium sediminicola TaxID=3114879 RepID=UPI0031F1F94A
MYEEITTFISTLGFPISISIYLLVRFEKKIEELNKSISDLTIVIANIAGNGKK